MSRYLLPCLLLAGCGAAEQARPEPIIITKEVVVPGPPSPCVPASVEAMPAYPDSNAALKAAADAAERYQLIAAGRSLRIARLAELEPVVASCPRASK